VNSFEQFCINWANEKLQQVFIELTLKGEQEEYLKEGIAWTPIDYFNNQIIVDLIEQKPLGIVSLLDEECLLAKGTDKTFLEKISKNLDKHERFTVASKQSQVKKDAHLTGMNENCFKCLHYAGEVIYDVTGFLDKSKDTFYTDCILG
jgi:myosin-1